MCRVSAGSGKVIAEGFRDCLFIALTLIIFGITSNNIIALTLLVRGIGDEIEARVQRQGDQTVQRPHVLIGANDYTGV
jgi:hypothetical protein